jgi:hypothetical protein
MRRQRNRGTDARRLGAPHSTEALTTITKAALTGALQHVTTGLSTQRYQRIAVLAPAVLLTDDAGREHRQPAVLLISNNPYALDQPIARGTRPALDSGQLGVMVLDAPADRPHPPARAWTAAHLEVAAQSTPVSPVMDAAYPGGVGVSASLAFSSAFRSGGSGLGLTR